MNQKLLYTIRIVVLFTIGISILSKELKAQLVEINRQMPMASGDVYKVAQHQDKLYMIGNFVELYAPNSRNIGIYSNPTNSFESDQIDVNGEIFEIITDNNGGWILGGRFTEVNGVSRPYLAHIDANYNLLPLSLDTNNGLVAGSGSAEIRSMFRYNDTLYLAGNFISINGQARGSIAAIDLISGNLLPFNISISNGSFASNIQKIALHNGKIFIGGNFNTINGQGRLHAAAVAPGTGNILNFNPILNNTVFDFGFRGDTVFIGGSFSTVNTTGQKRGICAVSEQSSLHYNTWGSSLAPANNNSRVKKLIVSDSLLYIAGKFNNVGVAAKIAVAALRINDGSVSAFDAQINLNSDVNSMALENNYLYIGGRFVGQSGSIQNIAKIDRFTGIKDSNFDFSARAAFTTVDLVNTIAIQGSEVLFGGGFPSIGGKLRNRFAVIDLPSGNIDDFKIDFNNFVLDFQIDTKRNAIFFGGSFNSVDGNTNADVHHFVGYDLTTKSPLNLNQNISINNAVNSFEIFGDSLYLAGNFTSVNGNARRYLAAYNFANNSVTPWFPSQFNNTTTPNFPMGKVIIAKSGPYKGYMILSSTASQSQASSSIDGSPFPTNLAPAVSTFGPGLIRDAIFFDDELIVVGTFSGRVRRYKGGTLESSNFISGFTEVNAVTLKREKIIFGGDFSNPNLRFAVIDKNTGNFIPPLFTRNAKVLGFDKNFATNTLYLCGVNSSLENNVEEIVLNSINVQSVSATNLCPSESFNVNFSVDFPLQAGTNFDLEISDINGLFNNSNPTILGSLSSNTGGNLTANLPAVIAAGNYQLRLRASGNQLTKVLDSGINVLSLPAPGITLSSAGFCFGDTLELSATNSTYNQYTWFKNGIQLPDSTPSISSSDSGFFQLIAFDTSGCFTDTSSLQLNFSAPIILEEINNYFLCLGEDLVVKTNVTGTNNTFQWFKNGTALSNTADSLALLNLSASDSGLYQFVVSDPVSGCVDSSNSFVIIENPLTFTNDSNMLYRFSLDSTLVDDINGEKLNFFFPGAQTFLNVSNRFGRPSSAMRTQNNSSHFQLPAVNSSEISIAFWVNLNFNNGQFTTLLSTSPTTVPPLLINHADNNKIGTFFGGTWQSSMGNEGSIPINTWKHITYTADSSNYSIYVDGNLVLSGTNGVDHAINPLDRLGNNNPSNVNQGLRGELDDVQYFNRTLNELEVKALFEAPEVFVEKSTLTWCEGDSIVLSTEVFPANPNYEYKWLLNGALVSGADSSSLIIPNLSEANVGNYTALVGNSCNFGRSFISRIPSTSPLQHRYPGNDFKDVVGNNTILHGGNIGQGPNHLNEPNSAFVTGNPNSQFLDIIPVKSNEITVSMWVKRNSANASFGVLFTSNTSGEVPLLLNSQGNLGVFTNSFVPSTATLALQTWYHVVFVANGNSNVIYVDGVEVLNISNGINFDARPLSRFLNNTPANVNQGFLGAVSDIQIYTKALSAAEITLIQGVNVNQEEIISCNGQDVSLEVTSNLHPTTVYQWFVNDTAIVGANTTNLQMPNIDISFEGNYKVKASNGCIHKTSNDISLNLIDDSLKFAQHKYEGGSFSDMIGTNDLINTPLIAFSDDHLGRSSKSFSANSVNNYLDFSQPIDEERATLSFWLQRTGGQDATILGSNVSNQSQLAMNFPGGLGIRKNNTFIPIGFTITPNIWYHIVVTFNGPNQNIYVDGNLIFSTNDGIDLKSFPIQRIFNNVISTSQFIGRVSNLEVFHKTATDDEVELLGGFAAHPSDFFSCGTSEISLEASLINNIAANAQWYNNSNTIIGQDSLYLNIPQPLQSDSGTYKVEANVACLTIVSEEAQVSIDSGATIVPIHAYGRNGFNDLFGNNNIQSVGIQLNSGTTWMGGAFRSNSTGGTYMDISPVASNELTVAFWLEREMSANFTTLITGSAPGDVHLLLDNNGDIGLFNNTGFIASNSTPISLNTWHHVVYVANGTRNTIYVDGVEVFDTNSGVDAGIRPIARFMNNTNVSIGQGLRGSMGDIQIFDYAVSPLEAKLLAGLSNNIEDTTLCSGNALSFSVGTMQQGNFKYSWFKNGNLLAGIDSNSYVVNNPTQVDTGFYHLQINAACVNLTTDTARVDIIPGNIVIDSQPVGGSFCEGDSVLVGFSSASLIDSIQWFEVNMGLLAGQNQGNLDLSSLSGTGNYYALLSNFCETKSTDTVNLTIVPQFSINNAPANIGITELCENTAVTLQAQTSIGGLNYDWLKDGISLGINSLSFSINSVQFSDNGVYSFVASNSCFADTAVFANLNVGTASSVNEVESACSNFVWRGNTYNQSGNYSDTLVVANACDTIFNLSLTILGTDSTTTSITSCTPTLFLGTNLNATGVYDITTTNILGCDSVVSVNFTLDNQLFTQLNETACDNFNFNGNLLSNSGTYTDTIFTQAGCDSIVTLNLSIFNSFTDSISIQTCNSFVFDGNTYSTTGIYPIVYTSINGCDSTVVLDLTIDSVLLTNFVEVACDSFTFSGQVYNTTGIYVDSLLSVDGCDSLVILDLTVNNSSNALPRHAYPGNGYLDAVGSNDLLPTAGIGLDVDHLGRANRAFRSNSSNGNHIDIAPVGNTELSVSFWLRRNSNAQYTTLMQSNTTGEVHLIMDDNGSIGVFTTQFFGSAPNTIFLNSWHHITYVANGDTNKIYVDGVEVFSTINGVNTSARPITRFLNNTVTNIGQGLNGSIADIKVFYEVLSPTEIELMRGFSNVIQDTSICAGQSLNVNANMFGTATFQYQWKKDGVDLPGATAATLSILGMANQDTGIYSTQVFAGCKSITSDGFNIGIETFEITSQPNGGSFCENDASGIMFSSSGNINSVQWFDSLGNALTGQTQNALIINQIPQSGSYFAAINTNCGIFYTDTIAVNIVPNFSIVNAPGNVSTTEFCAGSTLYLEGQTTEGGLSYEWFKDDVSLGINDSILNISSVQLNDNGVYKLVASNSCFTDTAIFASVLVVNEINVSFTETACEIFEWRGMSYNLSGVYRDTVLSSSSCDSIFTLTLNIISIDKNITVNENILTASQDSATYQWVDCDNNFAPIPGATAQSYTATQSGNYAVIITQGACSDTSGCEEVIVNSVAENLSNMKISIFPNPTSGILTIETSEILTNLNLVIRDLLGRIIVQEQVNIAHQISLDLSAQSQGVYFLSLGKNNNIKHWKFVIK